MLDRPNRPVREPKPKRGRKAKAERSPDAAYYEDAATWDHDLYRSMRRSRARAWTMTFIAFGFAALCLFALLLLLPLKQFEPYVVRVNEETGYVDMVRGLQPGDLTDNEAITQSNIVRYITAREQYDVPDLEQNYNRVVLMSEGKALNDYQRLWSASNDDNPAKVFGTEVDVRTTIKSIAFLNDRTASVRFLRNQTQNNVTQTTHWVATIGFRYVEEPVNMLQRFDNPLGFKVSTYRVDQEVLGTYE